MAHNLLLDPRAKAGDDGILSSREAAKDIEVLIYALETAYPAVWSMTEVQWTQVTSHLKSLSFPHGLGRKSFGSTIADALWNIPDGHLKVRLGAETLGEKQHANLRKPTTGSNISHDQVWSIESHKAGSEIIPVIGISWFPQSSESHWQGFLEAIENLLSCPTLVFDLRGNIGGDDSKAIEMVSQLLGAPLEFDWIREIVCESTEAYQLQANTYAKTIWNNYTSKNLTPPPALENKLSSFKEKAAVLKGHPPRKELIESNSPKEKINQPKYSGKIFVLVDAATSSSGEWTALYLKRHPNTVLVGENTYGMIHFGNSGTLRLPNSQLEVTLCMKINELTDGRFYEKTGIAADIPVTNKNSLNYVLSNLINP